MKISYNHPLAKHKLIVSQQLSHNGVTYSVTNENFGQYELEPEKLCSWKKRSYY